MARLVVGAVGAVVGFAIGGPAGALQGFTLAYGLTAFLDPNKKVGGSRLSDLRAPQANYGAVIPYIDGGSERVPGVIVWASDKRGVDTTTTIGGKGGPGVDSTTTTYYMDMLVVLACNECDALRRVWANGLLIWTNADDADADSIVASSRTNFWTEIRFHSGAAGQLPDPTYEAAVGVGNAPAYRGRASVFIEALNLGQSGQMPILTYEVVREASADWATTNFATWPLDPLYSPSSTVAGISAMDPGGFDFLYGKSHDPFNGSHLGFNVYHVAPDGSIELTGSVDYLTPESNAIQGNSDVSCLVVLEYDPSLFTQIDHFTVYRASGSSTEFSFGVANTTDSWVFSMRGNRVAISSRTPISSGGTQEIRIFNATSGALVAMNVMGAESQSVAIGDGVVYALESSALFTGNVVWVFDLVTGALIDSIATPIAFTQTSITTDENGNLYAFALGTISDQYPVYKWDGLTWTKLLNEQQLYAPPTHLHATYAASGVLAMQRFDDSGLAPYREQFYVAVSRIGIVLPTLGDVCRRLSLRTRQLELTDLDYSALDSQYVRGLAVTQVSPTRATLETLMGAFFFEIVEGPVLRAVLRGGAPAATIPYEDMAAGEEGSEEPLPIKRLNDIEAPAFVTVRYSNFLADYQDGAERSDRLITESETDLVVEAPIVMTPTEARRVAEANAMDLQVGLLTIGPVALSRKYLKLEPTDVVILTNKDGSLFRARIQKITSGAGVARMELALDDASAIVASIDTDSDYTAQTLVRLLADTQLELLDIPILRNVDDGPGHYAAVKGLGSGRWPGAEADRSLDDVAYEKIFEIAERAVIGSATTILGDYAGVGFDEINSLTVDVEAGTLSSSTRDLLLTTTANALLVGDEIIQFRSATLVSPGVYALRGFLRGRRGTEWAMAGHGAAERVVLLQTTGMRRVTDELADRNVSYFWKGVTFGQARADVDPEEFANTDVGLKPFAPVDLRVDDDSVLRWHRRSRLISAFLDTVDVPLGEASESYDVELRDAGDVLVDSVTVDEPAYQLNSLTPGDFLTGGASGAHFGLRTISGDIVGMVDETPSSSASGKRIKRFDSSGTYVAQSDVLGQYVGQMDNDGDAIYLTAWTQVSLMNVAERVVKISRTSLTTIDAQYDATLGDWPTGLIHDGTNVWIAERGQDQLRKLDSSTLASVATYAMASQPCGLFQTTGKIWVACFGSNEIARFDIGGLAEDLRFSCVTGPMDVFVAGSLVFVAGSSRLGVYDTSGTLVIEHELQVLGGASYPQRGFAHLGSQVAACVLGPGSPNTKVALLSDSTGEREALIAAPAPFVLLAWVAGALGSDLALAGSRSLSGGSFETRRYEIGPADLAGYTVTVWQNSASVGRGYPATLEL